MFYFAGYARGLLHAIEVYSTRFPHSEIPGSQVATHLPEAYRCYATSFIAFSSLGIHHSPLCANHPNADFFVLFKNMLRLPREIGGLEMRYVGLCPPVLVGTVGHKMARSFI